MKNIHEIEIKVDEKTWTKALDESFKKAQKNVKVNGFRKGKVPRNIFEKNFGIESLYEEAINIVLPDSYTKAIEKDNLIPIIMPKIDIKEVNKKGVTILFTITTKPEVKIKKYTQLGVKKEKVSVTKKEIDDQINSLLEKYADIVIKDGKIENGDIAVIDYEGFKDDVAFDGGKAENYPLEIGSNTFIPGFEEQLIGLKAGDEKDINVTFPKDYHAEDLKGAKVVFKVKVHEVKTKELPSMNEEFFKDLGYDDVKTEEQLRDLIKVDLEAKKEYEIENKYVDDLLAKAEENTEVELPEELIEEEMQGITLEMFYKFTNSNEDALKDQMREEATKRVKYRFMLEEIATIEKVEVTDKEADKEAENLSKKYNMTKEELIKEFGGIEAIKYELQMQKVIDIMKK